jgi:hypothetical protein
MLRRRLVLFSLALLLTVLGMTVVVGVRTALASVRQPSLPHATCSGNGCNGQDPQTSGCAADAYTVQTAVLSSRFVQLRYSPRCGTNWGRVLSRIGRTHLYVRVQRIDGRSYFGSISTGLLMYSPMVYAPVLKARACAISQGAADCTAFV